MEDVEICQFLDGDSPHSPSRTLPKPTISTSVNKNIILHFILSENVNLLFQL